MGRAILPAAAFQAALVFWLPATLPAQSKLTMFPPVRGLHEMVGSCNNFEVEAGMRILAEGGNLALHVLPAMEIEPGQLQRELDRLAANGSAAPGPWM